MTQEPTTSDRPILSDERLAADLAAEFRKANILSRDATYVTGSMRDIVECVRALSRRAEEQQEAVGFDMLAHLARQREWSGKTFGPGPRTAGVIDHIRKELREIEADPTDISEWIDVVILALDGAWRAGYQPQEIIGAMVAKQTKNEGRNWPDWRTMSPDKAIEHDRSGEQAGASPPPVPAAVSEEMVAKARDAVLHDPEVHIGMMGARTIIEVALALHNGGSHDR